MWNVVQHLLKDAGGKISFLKKLCTFNAAAVRSQKNKNGAAALGSQSARSGNGKLSLLFLVLAVFGPVVAEINSVMSLSLVAKLPSHSPRDYTCVRHCLQRIVLFGKI